MYELVKEICTAKAGSSHGSDQCWKNASLSAIQSSVSQTSPHPCILSWKLQIQIQNYNYTTTNTQKRHFVRKAFFRLTTISSSLILNYPEKSLAAMTILLLIAKHLVVSNIPISHIIDNTKQ